MVPSLRFLPKALSLLSGAHSLFALIAEPALCFRRTMDYVDPHHKRTDFTAESFSSSDNGAITSIAFVGHGRHESVVLQQRDTTLVATVPEAPNEFVLRKVQLLRKFRWLILDFEENQLLRRIVIYIDRLDAGALDTAVAALIGTRSLPYYNRHE